MLVTKKESREEIIGSYEEIYRNNCMKFGVKRANLLYWVELRDSAMPFLLRAIERLGIAAAAIAGFRKWTGL